MMIKSTKKITFIREFYTLEQAQKFAREKQGKININYDWDSMDKKIIKIYLVKY